MAKTISILSDLAINQIAAGEVVEGPASVVKELMENAIDAGADKVCVEIKGGGHFLIEVVDNGKGMSREDVELSIQRYATSKITSLEDLSKLESMGFRGEALAAISSVSKFSISSSTGGVGVFLRCSGGKEIEVKETSRKQGTTICVESLFYNTPARKKFQKARGPSTTEIIKGITKLSLCHKDVEFFLTVDGKEVFHVDSKSKSRLKDVLGKDFFTPSVLVKFEAEGLTIEGVIAAPEKTRSNRAGQYLVVNRRNIYSLLISNAVAAGFGTSIGKGDFPLFFLSMVFDPSKIDINVHPQKKEVRFQEEEVVFSLVREAISSALTGSFAVEKNRNFPSRPYPENVFKEFTYVEKQDEISLNALDRKKVFVQPSFEEKGHLTIKMLWDELCIVEVTPPHSKFVSIEERSCVLVDLSLLERKHNKKEISFEAQKLLQEEEIFLTKGEIGICREFNSSFKELGMFFSVNAVSITLEQVPQLSKRSIKDIFMYAMHLFQNGEHILDIKDKIIFRILRKKRYSEEEAIFLIEKSAQKDNGVGIFKKDIRGLCKEYKS